MTKFPLILDLSEIKFEDSNIGGGKATNLSEMIRGGFSVPNGFVITTIAYTQFLEYNALEKQISDSLRQIRYDEPEMIKKCSKSIQDAIKESQFPPVLTKEIEAAYNRLPMKQVAIRSSATAEDLPTASFAGQQETYLNIQGIDWVLQHVKLCYASLWTTRALSYRYTNNIQHLDVKLAVVVQGMVRARNAGVLFTANPISLEKNEILLESNFGLGESIVSGQINPDHFTVLRKEQGGEETFEILSKEIGTKTFAVQETASGVELVELSDSKSQEPSLNDQQILRLAQLGRKIERHFGVPQDIEWAIDEENKIHILQSRPITSLTSIPTEDENVWTRGYSDDYWNDPVSPLFFELLGDHLTLIVNNELNSIMGYPSMDSKLLKLYRGHAYFNLNILKRKVEYEIPTFLRNDDILIYFPEGTGSYGRETMKKLPFRLKKRLIAELRVMIYDNSGSITRTARTYEKWTEEEFLPFCNQFDAQMSALGKEAPVSLLLDLAEEINRIMITHFRLVRYGIPVHNIGMNLLIQFLLARFINKKTALRLYPILISGLEHKTSETNNQVQHLAEIIQKTSELRSIILDKPSNELEKYLKFNEDENVQAFLQALHQFMDEYGDRGFTREPYYPRWHEAPQYLFNILKSLVRDQDLDLHAREAKSITYRKKVESYVYHKVRSQIFGFLKWKLFSIILGFARKYIIFRENQRFNLDRWICRSRKVYLEIGKDFVQQKILQNPSDIFFLKKSEIKKLAKQIFTVEEIRKIASLVKKRREEFFRYENTTPP
ncbi:MAG: PEP/pyruvate-binding domain-containing protein, partial [Candidatus Hodarchaeota archaeon]